MYRVMKFKLFHHHHCYLISNKINKSLERQSWCDKARIFLVCNGRKQTFPRKFLYIWIFIECDWCVCVWCGVDQLYLVIKPVQFIIIITKWNEMKKQTNNVSFGLHTHTDKMWHNQSNPVDKSVFNMYIIKMSSTYT